MVQYVARYQYTNMEHAIQTYSAKEVRSVIRFYTIWNHTAMETHKKLCAAYGPQCTSLPYTYTKIFVYLCRTTVSYDVKLYYTSNFHSTVRPNCVLHVCVLVSRDILYHSTWNFYSVSSDSKLSSPINLVSFRSFVVAYKFKVTYFWDNSNT